MGYLVTFANGRFVQVTASDLGEASSVALEQYRDDFGYSIDPDLMITIEPSYGE